jgi:hypothetical protein
MAKLHFRDDSPLKRVVVIVHDAFELGHITPIGGKWSFMTYHAAMTMETDELRQIADESERLNEVEKNG